MLKPTPPRRTMPAKMQANYPKNARSTGRAVGALGAAAGAIAATGVRNAREVSDAEYRGFVKGKTAGRQADSSGRMIKKGPAAAKETPKKSNAPANASYFTKALMK
jgi:hypothetical protein